MHTIGPDGSAEHDRTPVHFRMAPGSSYMNQSTTCKRTINDISMKWQGLTGFEEHDSAQQVSRCRALERAEDALKRC